MDNDRIDDLDAPSPERITGGIPSDEELLERAANAAKRAVEKVGYAEPEPPPQL